MGDYTLYAKKSNGNYVQLTPYIWNIRMRGVADEDVVTLDVSLCDRDESKYWGWIPADENYITIASHRSIFNIHFPYGFKGEEERGHGKAYGLKFIERRDKRSRFAGM